MRRVQVLPSASPSLATSTDVARSPSSPGPFFHASPSAADLHKQCPSCKQGFLPRICARLILTTGPSIICRALQGIGGSGLYSLAQISLIEIGPRAPGTVGALIGITLSISYILGPLLGGAIGNNHWRWIFFMKYGGSPLSYHTLNVACNPEADEILASQLASLPPLDGTSAGLAREGSRAFGLRWLRSTSWVTSSSSRPQPCWYMPFSKPDL